MTGRRGAMLDVQIGPLGQGMRATHGRADGNRQGAVEQTFPALQCVCRRNCRGYFDTADLALGERCQPSPIGTADNPPAASMGMLHEKTSDLIVAIADAGGCTRIGCT